MKEEYCLHGASFDNYINHNNNIGNDKNDHYMVEL